jgi:hypothetical protein
VLGVAALSLVACSGDDSFPGSAPEAGSGEDSGTGLDATVDASGDGSSQPDGTDAGVASDSSDGGSSADAMGADASDATVDDTGAFDSGTHDSGGVDASGTDSGDAGSVHADSGEIDSGNTDAGGADTGADAVADDSGNGDSGGTDSSVTDSATESGGMDSGGTDGGQEASGPTWSSQDIGAVTAAGSWCLGAACAPAQPDGTFQLSGSGADIGLCGGVPCGNGTTDEFFYVYQAVSGDATLTARVASIAMVTDWSKAFLAMRDGLNDDAAFVSLAVPATASYGYFWFYRGTPGGGLAFPAPATPGGTPVWFRIVRRGNVFTGLYSADGVAWNQLASMTIAMSTTLQIGLAVVSRMNGSLTMGVFDNVSLTTP